MILTAALAIALLLFVSAASGLATLYTIRIRNSLITSEASNVAQIIQQVYLVVNSSQLPSDTKFVVKTLGLPNALDGYPYKIVLNAKYLCSFPSNKETRVILTVNISLIGTIGYASSNVILGSNFALYNFTGANSPYTVKCGTNTHTVPVAVTSSVYLVVYKCPSSSSVPTCSANPNRVVISLAS